MSSLTPELAPAPLGPCTLLLPQLRSVQPAPRPRDWRILVPLSAVGHGWRIVDPSGPQGETFVDVDPADPQVTFRDDRIRDVVGTLAELLAGDPYIVRAFHLLKLARTLRSEYEPAQGRVISLSRASGRQPVRFVVLPAGDAKLRHSSRPFAYLEPAPAGYLRAETGGSSAILIYGPPALARTRELRRSLVHELAHYINHMIQDSGLPYSGRERQHSVYDIRTAAFAYVEGEPQAFLAFVQSLVEESGEAEPAQLIRRPRRRAAWVKRLLTPNQFLRSELACGRLLGALLTDRSIRNHYLRPSFYDTVAPAYPELKGAYGLTRKQVRAAITPAENAFIKVQYVRLRHDPADTLEFLRAYLTEFPSQRRLALRVIAAASSGLLVSEDAPRRALAEACARIRAGAARTATLGTPQTPGGQARELTQAAEEIALANRRWWTRLVRRGTGLVGDPRTPLPARTRRGEVDLNRAGAEELARCLRLPSVEAAKLVRNRAALRPGEYLELMDVLRPPPRALRQSPQWDPIVGRTWKKVLAAVEAAAAVSDSPLRRALVRSKDLLVQRSSDPK